MDKILIVQPHSDDAILSCSRFLLGDDFKVKVLTIDNDSKRLEEDRKVAKTIGVKYIPFAFDVQDENDYGEFFKQYGKQAELNDDNVLDFYRKRFGRDKIKGFRKALRNKILSYIDKGYVICCPLGIGHPFHYFVRYVLRKIEDDFIFYREFPHSYKRKAKNQFESELKNIELLQDFDDEDVNTLKYEIAQKFYKSQSGFFFYEHDSIKKLYPEEFYIKKAESDAGTVETSGKRHVNFYVISKGRPNGKTFDYFNRCDWPYTVVVEPQDEALYRDAGHKNILVLPKNDMGVSYTLNYSKNQYDGKNPVVIMDDDIMSWFWNLPDIPKLSLSLKTPEELREFFQAFCDDILKEDFDIGTIGKSAFDWNNTNVAPRIAQPGSKTRYFQLAVVFVINSLKLKKFDFDETLKFKSDIDYSLKCMYLGLKVAKFTRFLQQTTMNKDGKQKGGLAETYKKTENLQQANDIMLERWPNNLVVDPKKKPTNGIPELRTIYKVFDEVPNCVKEIQKIL